MEEHANAQLFQPLGEPLGVGVERLAARDFITDSEDFGIHGSAVRDGRENNLGAYASVILSAAKDLLSVHEMLRCGSA